MVRARSEASEDDSLGAAARAAWALACRTRAPSAASATPAFGWPSRVATLSSMGTLAGLLSVRRILRSMSGAAQDIRSP